MAGILVLGAGTAGDGGFITIPFIRGFERTELNFQSVKLSSRILVAIYNSIQTAAKQQYFSIFPPHLAGTLGTMMTFRQVHPGSSR
jgi:hypothetical protein